MAATQARSGFGAKLARGDGATPTETFTNSVEVTGVSGGDFIQNTADATHMESPDGYVEKIPTLREIGDWTINYNFLAGNPTQDGLRADNAAGVKRNFRVIIPGAGKRFEGAAYVKSVGQDIPLDNKMTSSVVLTPTGKWVIANDP